MRVHGPRFAWRDVKQGIVEGPWVSNEVAMMRRVVSVFAIPTLSLETVIGYWADAAHAFFETFPEVVKN